jgi:pyridoxamine 5'-phosphate oxidase
MSPKHDPIGEFIAAFARARRRESGNATACSLATAEPGGRPSVRLVLLKGVDERGFVFYTNYGSRKARELEANPRAALCFYWPTLGEQVRVEGAVDRVASEEADAYFASRARASRVGAWASKQSEPLASRTELLSRFARYGTKYGLGPVPRPPFWGGYRLVPNSIEFWFDKAYRLHDRRLFRREGEDWLLERLYP